MTELRHSTAQQQENFEFLSTNKSRKAIKEAVRSPYDPAIVIKETKEDLETFLINNDSRDALFNLERRANDLAGIISLDNHSLITGSVQEKYRTLIIEYSQRLEKEVVNPTITEKTLIELTAIAYGRYISNADRLETCLSLDTTTLIMVSHCAMLGKEIDRSHRQLVASLSALKSLRSPPIAVSIVSAI